MLSQNDLISVIVPCYNQAKYLSDSLSSVLNQTFGNWECFIVNDGSTDNTEEVASVWLKKDKRFKYIRTEHGGPSKSRNAALKLISGNYLQLLDADDVIDSKKFEIQLRLLENMPKYSLCISDYFTSTESDLLKPHSRYLTPKFKSEDYIYELITNWQTKLSIPLHCFLIKSSLFKENRIFLNETLPNHVDWEFWMNIFKLNPIVIFVDLKLATYRIHDYGICGNKKLMKTGYLQAINLQKGYYKKSDREFDLLTRKYNEVKYGSSKKYKITAFIFGHLKKFAKKAIKKVSSFFSESL